MGTLLFSLQNITIRVRDKHILQGTSWEIQKGCHWAVLGPNGSGKTSLVRALVDEYTIIAGRTDRHPSLLDENAVGYVSFEQQQDLINNRERSVEAYYYSGEYSNTYTVENVLYDAGNKHSSSPSTNTAIPPDAQSGNVPRRIASELGLETLLTREVATLSNGEIRRTLLGRAMARNPRLLILDEPFEGIDPQGRRQIADMVRSITRKGPTTLILVTNRPEQLVEEIPMLLCVRDGTVVYQGPTREFFSKYTISQLYGSQTDESAGRTKNEITTKPIFNGSDNTENGEPIIDMRDVTIRLDDSLILSHLNWQVKKGENWLITGENGSGKSTLLKLITGEISQAYANNITLFGKRKGHGTGLWEIRKKIGYLSTELHMHYRKNISLEEVILSGFYDSVGLFSPPTDRQVETANRLLQEFGFFERRETPLAHLSYGEQRIILLARALVKAPELLILDEPLQGLDPAGRNRFLEIIKTIGTAVKTDQAEGRTGSHTATHMVLVTHHAEELPPCFHKQLIVEKIDQKEKHRYIRGMSNGFVLESSAQGSVP